MRINELFPETHADLCEWMGYGPAHEYSRVYQFCACNFSRKNCKPDLDDDFNIIPEVISCPVRHHCKHTICKPKLFNSITPRERDVIKLFIKYTEEEIAERLFISPATVHNHITNIYNKLNFTGKAAPKLLVDYAHRMKIVN